MLSFHTLECFIVSFFEINITLIEFEEKIKHSNYKELMGIVQNRCVTDHQWYADLKKENSV